MYARVTTFQGSPAGIDEGVRTAREQVIPAASRIAGFRGMLAFADRTTGKTIGVPNRTLKSYALSVCLMK